MKLQGYVTVEGDTYPEGTDTAKVANAEHRKVLEAMDQDSTAASDPDAGSVGAGKYDGREWTKDKLSAELDQRNSDLSEDKQVKPEGTSKGDYVAALELLDERYPVTA